MAYYSLNYSDYKNHDIGHWRASYTNISGQPDAEAYSRDVAEVNELAKLFPTVKASKSNKDAWYNGYEILAAIRDEMLTQKGVLTSSDFAARDRDERDRRVGAEWDRRDETLAAHFSVRTGKLRYLMQGYLLKMCTAKFEETLSVDAPVRGAGLQLRASFAELLCREKALHRQDTDPRVDRKYVFDERSYRLDLRKYAFKDDTIPKDFLRDALFYLFDRGHPEKNVRDTAEQYKQPFLLDVTLPASIKVIGDRAFYAGPNPVRNTKVRHINLEVCQNLTAIGTFAFYGAALGPTLTLASNTALVLQDRSFASCIGITDVVFGKQARVATHAFARCGYSLPGNVSADGFSNYGTDSRLKTKPDSNQMVPPGKRSSKSKHEAKHGATSVYGNV
jgi:hypothetical protein